jgi:hypothetical protein
MTVLPEDFSCLNVGANTTVLTLQDPSGRQATCTGTVTVIDTMPPIAICQNLTLTLDSMRQGVIQVGDIDDNSFDGCGLDQLTLDITQFDTANIGLNLVTLSILDVNGNVSSCQATVTVRGIAMPAKLAEQGCIACGEIHLIFCQGAPISPNLDEYLNGIIEQNDHFQPGNSLYWYKDDNGMPGSPYGGTGGQPNSPSTLHGDTSYVFWVSQVEPVWGQISTPTRFEVIVLAKNNPGNPVSINVTADAVELDLFDKLGGSPDPGGRWIGPSQTYNQDRGTFNPNFMFPGIYSYELVNPPLCPDSVATSTVTVTVTPVVSAALNAKVLLQGNLDTTLILMHDSLRKNHFIPLVEPFSQLGYTHINGGGYESFSPTFFESTGKNAIVDWVLIELRSAADSSFIKASRAALLQRDGDIVDLDGISPVRFNRLAPAHYYVVISHRNHLSIMTVSPIQLFATGTSLLDFSAGQLPLFGIQPQQVIPISSISSGIHVMIGGDADFNGQIQNADDVNHWSLEVGASSYWGADYDCDGQVQNNDRVWIWSPNVGKGTQVPLRSN